MEIRTKTLSYKRQAAGALGYNLFRADMGFKSNMVEAGKRRKDGSLTSLSRVSSREHI